MMVVALMGQRFQHCPEEGSAAYTRRVQSLSLLTLL
jgi:hypothetical protein